MKFILNDHIMHNDTCVHDIKHIGGTLQSTRMCYHGPSGLQHTKTILHIFSYKFLRSKAFAFFLILWILETLHETTSFWIYSVSKQIIFIIPVFVNRKVHS